MPRWLGPGLLLGLGFVIAAKAQGPTQFDGRYTGELILTKVIKGDCTRPPLGALYPLTISGGEVRFTYVPRFDTLLSGKVGDNGIFQASSRQKRGLIHMTGSIQGDNLTAYIVSPSCNYIFRAKH
jgi:hypothetical protein